MKALEQLALDHVNHLDLIDDYHRRIAGESYLAGAFAALRLANEALQEIPCCDSRTCSRCHTCQCARSIVCLSTAPANREKK